MEKGNDNGALASWVSDQAASACTTNSPFLAGRAQGTNCSAHQVRQTQRKEHALTSPIDGGIRVAFIDEHSFTRECIALCLQNVCGDISCFATIESCLTESPERFDLIVYHMHEGDQKEIISGLKRAADPVPIVILGQVDRLEAILDALEAGARGYMATSSTTLEMALGVISVVRAGGTFAPLGHIDSETRPELSGFGVDRQRSIHTTADGSSAPSEAG